MQGNISALRALHFENESKSNGHRGHLMSNQMNGYPHGTNMNHHHRPMPLPRPMPRLHHAPSPQMHQHHQHQQPFGPFYGHRQHPRHTPRSPLSPNGLSSPISPPSSPSKKISKFCPCSRAQHNSLQTTSASDGKLEIVITKGGLPSNELLYIQQHCQYQVRYNDHEMKQPILLATIPVHFQMAFSFHSVAAFTQYIINKKFIRFRNRGPTQTRRVSLWRIYQFEGEQTLFNIWIVTKAAERALGIENDRSRHGSGVHIKKKKKNYHLAAHQVSVHRIDSLGEDVMKKIFSFVTGSKFHCWVHIHEVQERSRSNLVGLEYDANTRNVHVMRRSPALLKKVRNLRDPAEFRKQSVELFRAVY